MFLTASSRTSSRNVRRAKSSASMSGSHQSPTRSEHLDPEMGRQHALAAASYAFQRAHERGVAGGIVVSANALSRASSKPSSHVERGRSLARAGRVSETRKTIKERERERSQAGSSGIAQPQPRYGRPYSIMRYEECLTAEDGIASTPSSYRRIRKAKSMVTPQKPANITYTSGSVAAAGGRDPEKRGGEQIRSMASKPFLRAPKSMSHLLSRPSRRTHHPSPEPLDRDTMAEATQVARTLFLQQQEHRRLKAQTSFVMSTRGKVRQQRALRKTVRTSSLNSYGSAVSSSNQTTAKKGGLGEKARKLSFSIKETFKRVFQKSGVTTMERNDDVGAVPSQQVSASRQHFRDYQLDPAEGLHERYRELTPPHPARFQMTDGEVLSRVNSWCPSLREVPRDLQLVVPQIGSIRSGHSHSGASDDDGNETCGTNSWATRQPLAAEGERKLLGNVKENRELDRPSSTVGSRHGQNQKGYNVFARPMRHVPEGSASPPIDSARVYSALMKRIVEQSPQSKSRTQGDQNQDSGDRSQDEETTPVPPRRSGSTATQRTSYSHFAIASTAKPVVLPRPGSSSAVGTDDRDRFYTPASAFPPSSELSRQDSSATSRTGIYERFVISGQRGVENQGMLARQGSVASKRSYGSTIRPVVDEEDYRAVRLTKSVIFNPLTRMESVQERGGLRQARSVVFNPLQVRGVEGDDVFSSGPSPESRHGRQVSWEDHRPTGGSLRFFPAAGGEMMTGLTPQQIADLNEARLAQQEQHVEENEHVNNKGRAQIQNHILREARSTFFPNHGGPRITTPSPYKRALSRASQEDDEKEMMVARAGEGWRLRKISEGATGGSFGRSKKFGSQATLGGSSSVYSRTTSGDTPVAKEMSAVPSFGQMDSLIRKPVAAPAAHPVTAVVPVADMVGVDGSGRDGEKRRDWKGWMASEIAGLNRLNEERVKHARSKRGHQREGAQFCGDDTRVSGGGYDPYMANQASERNPLLFAGLAGGVQVGMPLPLGGVHGNVVPLVPPPRKREEGGKSASMFPLVNIGPPEVEVPAKSALRSGVRSTASTTSLRSSAFQNSVEYLNASRDRLLKARSLADIKNLARYSPGRARNLALARESVKSGVMMKEGGVAGGVELQGDENSSPASQNQSPYREDVDGSGILGRSQQRMVDLFLSSRRRKMRGSGSGSLEVEGDDAFL